ncbi:uncharacterized protein K452DRAFT_357495 [Aplosporella prunicola CBS 121167]|uniref:Uncharacterized protein n=1 Tax=Aplosporella prunicola CBS 121167 TaxID=1176127 RepID=A0A6A6BJU9_9PEZI|nr:uncharacterized protein K452DRAFT_357495 [Aplosporella prunicola CBS 121167]KAF2143908.1 hypothetical protein K452DRAFT_357495 [Aplosporella prunicola CBS 121167]
MSSWNPSTFWRNPSEMSTVEFSPDTKSDDSFLRQRYRKHSLAPSSPTVLKQIRAENGQRTSLWRQLGWLLLALIIVLPAVHYFFKDSFKPYRYRTHSGYLSKFEFLSQLLPEKYHAPLEDFSGVSIVPAELDIPLYAPFDNVDVGNQNHDRQLINSTVSQLRRIEIKFRNTSREMADLANLRNDHIKAAKTALNTLRVAAETGTGNKGTDTEELKQDIQTIIEALTNVEKHSDKYEAYRQIIPKDVHSIIRNGTEKQNVYAELKDDEAKFRVYCKAVEYEETLGELTREFKILLKATEELGKEATELAKTSLKACRHAYLIESPNLKEAGCSGSYIW